MDESCLVSAKLLDDEEISRRFCNEISQDPPSSVQSFHKNKTENDFYFISMPNSLHFFFTSQSPGYWYFVIAIRPVQNLFGFMHNLMTRLQVAGGAGL